jgi:hypothetical protein
MTFHENAGLGQVDFDLPFLKFSLSFVAGGCSERPGAVKARSLRRQRTLDGEDRSVTIPPGRKGTVASGFLVFPLLPLLPRPNQPCRHPSIRTLDERFLFRSVPVGCSRCSRCCHLLVDLSSISRPKLGQAINAVTGTRRSGAVLQSTNLNYAAAGNRSGLRWRSGS